MKDLFNRVGRILGQIALVLAIPRLDMQHRNAPAILHVGIDPHMVFIFSHALTEDSA